jgi:lactoylglutathione lyase
MIDKFGKVMIYVADPKKLAAFWTDLLGFGLIQKQEHEGKTLAVELSPDPDSDASIVLFDRAFVQKMSPEIQLGTPSIMFGSCDIDALRDELLKAGGAVGEVIEMNGVRTFNFADPEGNYFAVEEIESKGLVNM